MNAPAPGRAVVFHAGALGDSVMIWPLLRALKRARWNVMLVSAKEKATLAARELGIEAVHSEQPECTRLWAGRPADSLLAAASLIITFVADASTEAGSRWLAAVHASCPSAELLTAGPPASASRTALWCRFHTETTGAVEPRAAAAAPGPAVLHVGAGSPLKRWSLDHFITLSQALQARAHPCTLLAGEVEAERFSPVELSRFHAHGGIMCHSLADLAAHLRTAPLVIGGDSGPGHLAAQLGVPTLSLFGPTDPHTWAPTGPRVSVLAPPHPAVNMHWLPVAPVVARALSILEAAAPVT